MAETVLQEPKTTADIKALLKHLETEHRKANISDKTYKELKAKYKSDLQYMENTITTEETKPAAKTTEQPKQETKPAAKTTEQPKQEANQEELKQAEEKKEEQQPAPEAAPAQENPEPQQDEAIAEQPATTRENEEKKSGFFGKFFHKKTEPEQSAATETPVETIQETPAEAEVKKDFSDASIEIEKIKVMIDAIREQKTGLDESLRTVFENIGEIRSMSIQNDATASELNMKITKTDDEISQVRPKEIDKKFREMNEKLEKYEVIIEKIQTKTNDMADRINKAYDLLQGIGGIENLIKVNEDVQKKLADIKEATHYIERLGSKSERMFIDVKAGLDDLVVYKAKQESVEESIKDLIKNIDSLSGKLDTYETKKDAEALNTLISMLQKEVENINKVMAVAQANIPEPIFSLRKQRDDIMLFLESLEMQHKSGKLKTADYLEIRPKNLEKLQKIEEELKKEWKKAEEVVDQKNAAEISAAIKQENDLTLKPQEFVITQDYNQRFETKDSHGRPHRKHVPEFDAGIPKNYIDALRGNKIDANFLLPSGEPEKEETGAPEKEGAATPSEAQPMQETGNPAPEKQEAQQPEKQAVEKEKKRVFEKFFHKKDDKKETNGGKPQS
jgi:hypothetical protein